MQYLKPSVYLIAHTNADHHGVSRWMEHLGVPTWDTDAPTGAEMLIEMAGRRCYRSFETEDADVQTQNPNLTKVREGNESYIGNILKSKHGSVLEHAHVTFAIEDCSRVVTHELVRHRLCNFSQESLRFVRPTSLNMYFPDIFADLPETERDLVANLFQITVENLEEVQRMLVDVLGMDDTSKLFADKKKLQSAMRRLMPIGMTTGIIVTSNHRNWRHMLEMRTSIHAEEEIREVFCQIAIILADKYPAIYQDMYAGEGANNLPECKFTNSKV